MLLPPRQGCRTLHHKTCGQENDRQAGPRASTRPCLRRKGGGGSMGCWRALGGGGGTSSASLPTPPPPRTHALVTTRRFDNPPLNTRVTHTHIRRTVQYSAPALCHGDHSRAGQRIRSSDSRPAAARCSSRVPSPSRCTAHRPLLRPRPSRDPPPLREGARRPTATPISPPPRAPGREENPSS